MTRTDEKKTKAHCVAARQQFDHDRAMNKIGIRTIFPNSHPRARVVLASSHLASQSQPLWTPNKHEGRDSQHAGGCSHLPPSILIKNAGSSTRGRMARIWLPDTWYKISPPPSSFIYCCKTYHRNRNWNETTYRYSTWHWNRKRGAQMTTVEIAINSQGHRQSWPKPKVERHLDIVEGPKAVNHASVMSQLCWQHLTCQK